MPLHLFCKTFVIIFVKYFHIACVLDISLERFCLYFEHFLYAVFISEYQSASVFLLTSQFTASFSAGNFYASHAWVINL